MARRIGNVLDRRAAVGIALALILAAAVFASAAIFSVHQRAAQDQQICDAVQGVRNDLVASLKKIEVRALARATTEAERNQIKQAYEEDLIAPIGRPDCP